MADDAGVLPPPPPERSMGLRLGVFVVAVVLAGYAALHLVELRHGARWYDGAFVAADFQLPARLGAPVSVERVALPWAMAQGSGTLRVRATLVRFASGARAVRSVRVECGDDLAPGVTARAEVTDFSLRTEDDDALGHVTLDAVETAADGEHAHQIMLRADGVYVNPAARTVVPARAERDTAP